MIDNEKDPQFDLVILDYRMPKKDGLDVAKYILSVNARQKILLATAFSSEVLSQVGNSNEISNLPVLCKPYDFEVLLSMVEKLTSNATPPPSGKLPVSDTSYAKSIVQRHSDNPSSSVSAQFDIRNLVNTKEEISGCRFSLTQTAHCYFPNSGW